MKHPFIKKFIIIYLSAVALVLAYFIFKTLFLEDNTRELKQFNTTTQKSKKKEVVQEKEEARQFILLPKK